MFSLSTLNGPWRTKALSTAVENPRQHRDFGGKGGRFQIPITPTGIVRLLPRMRSPTRLSLSRVPKSFVSSSPIPRFPTLSSVCASLFLWATFGSVREAVSGKIGISFFFGHPFLPLSVFHFGDWRILVWVRDFFGGGSHGQLLGLAVASGERSHHSARFL